MRAKLKFQIILYRVKLFYFCLGFNFNFFKIFSKWSFEKQKDVDIESVDDKQFRIVNNNNNNNNRHLHTHLDEKQNLNNVDKTIEKDVVSFPTIVACIALILVFSSISIVFEK